MANILNKKKKKVLVEVGGFSYFSIVNLKEADVGREIQVTIPPLVEIGENILG